MHRLVHYFNNKTILILIFSIVILTAKWHIFLLSKLDLETKILFNYIADSKYWIPYIKFISEFTFNNSFDPDIKDLNSLPIPIGSLFVYSFFYKFFGLQSLIIVEFLAIFLFLLIFYKIFNIFCNDSVSLFISLLLTSLPSAFEYFNLNIFQVQNILDNLYSLRIHRPVFSNIFFFGCIYLLIKEVLKKNIIKKNILILSFLMGLLFSSFYYFFIIIFFSLTVVILFKINFKIDKIIYYLPLFFKSSSIFIATSLPFLFNLYFHENDVSMGAGLISLDFEKRILILKYYASEFSKIQFLLLFFVISIITFFFKKKANGKIIILFYTIFISSIFSPIFFFSISPSSGLIYHFNNNILLCAFLYIFVLFCNFLNFILKKNNKLSIFFAAIFLFFNIYYNLLLSTNSQNFLYNNDEVNEFKIIKTDIKKNFNNILDNKSLLTFDTNFMIWAILNNFRYLNIINHMWTPKKHEMIEDDLVKNFIFLELNKKDFEKFISNKFAEWRYFNNNLGQIFAYRYQANSLVTKKNEKFDNQKMTKFILESKPSLNQQVSISTLEKKRLISVFETNKNTPRLPDIIIINLKKDFLKNYKIDLTLYCNFFKGEFYSSYYLRTLSVCKD